MTHPALYDLQLLAVVILLVGALYLTGAAFRVAQEFRRRPLRLEVDRATGRTRQVPQEPTGEERAALARLVILAGACWAGLTFAAAPLIS